MRFLLLILALFGLAMGSLGFAAGALFAAQPLPACTLSATFPDPDEPEPEPVDDAETLTAELVGRAADER